MSTMTLGTLYRAVKNRLEAAGIETPDLDARLLISHALGVAPDDVVLKPDREVDAEHAILKSVIARRLKHEPVSKIIGTREFYGLEFDVNEHVLDPRADTETLVDAARRYLDRAGKNNPRILDLCCGSGCILATLLSLFPKATGVAADISNDALEVARGNFRKHGLSDRVSVVSGNLFEAVDGIFDLIVCNPPYIESSVIETLSDDVRLYDPMLALDGGQNGLAIYKKAFPQIRKYLDQGAQAFFEIGFDQSISVPQLAQNMGLRVIEVTFDHGGQPRVVCVS